MQRFPEPTSGFTHLAAALLSAVGLVWLLEASQGSDPAKTLSLVVYGISLILLFSASSALHLINGPPERRQLFRRFDHAAIYILIAGSYTPVCYNLLTGGWRWGMLGLMWGLAFIGVIYKLRFNWRQHLSTVMYVAMGWLGIIAAPVVIPVIPPGAVLLILASGLIHTVGAVIFALNKPNLHRYFNAHDLWHIFVMGGSALHFTLVLRYIV